MGQDELRVIGPFYNFREAAQYCGYAVDTFRDYLKLYTVPRYGPKKTRFAKSVLDKFMESPYLFLDTVKKQNKVKEPEIRRVKVVV
jgi:hypothetical protein